MAKRRMTPDELADHYIDVYLSGITSISNDAGWNGESMMSLMITFHGQIPHGQRNDQADLTMIHAIDKLREKHAEFDKIRRIVGEMLGSDKDHWKIKSLLATRFYQGLNPDTDKLYNDMDRVAAIKDEPVVESPEQAKKAWYTATQRLRRRAQDAREIVLQRMEVLKAA